MRCLQCGARRTGDDSVFCSRCGFYSYETWLMARRKNMTLYLAFLALYIVLVLFHTLT